MSTVNEIFNFKRFGAYAARSWSFYAKRYLIHASIFAGVVLLIMIAVCAFNKKALGVGDLLDMTPWVIFFTSLFFLTFPVVVMKPLKNRHTLIMENTVPVSTTEKWLFVLLNTTLAAALIWLVALAVTVLVGIAISGPEAFVQYCSRMHSDWLLYMLIGCLSVSAVMMYAGTMERRNHTASFILIMVTATAVSFLLIPLAPLLSEKFDMAMGWGPMFTFGQAYASSTLSAVSYTGGGWFFDMINRDPGRATVWLNIALTTVFWVAAWFNFRERSIK